jgi:hypothetical protein
VRANDHAASSDPRWDARHRTEGFFERYKPLKGGELWATVMTAGALCALPEEIEVTGAVAGAVPGEEAQTRTVTFSKEISEQANEALGEEGEEDHDVGVKIVCAGKTCIYKVLGGSFSVIGDNTTPKFSRGSTAMPTACLWRR